MDEEELIKGQQVWPMQGLMYAWGKWVDGRSKIWIYLLSFKLGVI